MQRERLGTLETAFSEIVQTLRSSHHLKPAAENVDTRPALFCPLPLSPAKDADSNPSSCSPPVRSNDRYTTSSAFVDARLPEISKQELTSIAETYWTFCESQPLPLFCGNETSFVASFQSREISVIHSVMATVNRFRLDKEYSQRSAELVAESTSVAYRLVLDRIASCNVELSTLQTMCLVVLLDIDGKPLYLVVDDPRSHYSTAAGRPDRARMICSMATTLANSAQLHLDWREDEDMREERKRCYWSIVLLTRLLGESGPTAPAAQDSLPAYPQCSTASPADVMKTTERVGQAGSPPPESSFSIVEVVLKLSEVWCLAQRYVQTEGMTRNTEGVFPWSAQSSYSRVTESFMNIGSRMPFGHRYRNMNIRHMTKDVLRQSRTFWAPWFLSRFMYHTIPCLLNHPLLLTLQIRGVRNVTEAFLQQSSFTVANHISWIMHYLDLMRSRNFVTFSPVLIYCVAVVATIELQRTFLRDHEQTAQSTASQQNFDKCLRFVSHMNQKWEYAARMVNHHL